MASVRQIANLIIGFTASGLGALRTGVAATMGAVSRSVASVGRAGFGLGLSGATKALTGGFGLLKFGAEKAWDAVKQVPRLALDGLKKGAIGAAVTFAGLGKTVKDTADEIRAVDNLAQGVDLSFGDTAAFENLARKFGVDVGSLRGGLAQFATQVAQANQGSETTQGYFRKLGIDVNDASGKTKDLVDLLGEVASAQKNLNGIERTGILAQLFGEDDFARLSPLLNSIGRGGSGNEDPYKGLSWASGISRPTIGGASSVNGGGLRDALDKEKRNGGAYTEKDLQAANRLRQALGGLQNVWNSLKSSLLQTFGPPFVALINIAATALRTYQYQIVAGLANAWNAVILPIADVFALLTVGYAPNGTWVRQFAKEIRELPRIIRGALAGIGDIFRIALKLAVDLRPAIAVVYDFISALLGVGRTFRTSTVDAMADDIADLQAGFRSAVTATKEFALVLLGLARPDQVTTSWIKDFYEEIRAIPSFFTSLIRAVFDFARALSGNTENIKTGWIKDYSGEIGKIPELFKAAVRGAFDLANWLKSFGPTISKYIRKAFDYVESIDWSLVFLKLEAAAVNIGMSVAKGLMDVMLSGREAIGQIINDLSDFSTYVRTVSNDVAQVWEAGTPESATTFWGKIAGYVSEVVTYIGKLWEQLDRVFVQGKRAEEGFAWLNAVKEWVTNLQDAARTLYEKFGELRKFIFDMTGMDIAKGAAIVGILKMTGALTLAIAALQVLLPLFGLLGGGAAAAGGGVLAALLGGAAAVGTGVLAVSAAADLMASRENLEQTAARVRAELDAGYDKRAPKSGIERSVAQFDSGRGGYFGQSQDYRAATAADNEKTYGQKSYFGDAAATPSWVKSEVAAGVRDGIQGASTSSYMRPLALDQAGAARTGAPAQDVNVNVKWPNGATTKIPTNEAGLDAVRRSAAFTPGY